MVVNQMAAGQVDILRRDFYKHSKRQNDHYRNDSHGAEYGRGVIMVLDIRMGTIILRELVTGGLEEMGLAVESGRERWKICQRVIKLQVLKMRFGCLQKRRGRSLQLCGTEKRRM